MNDHDYELEAKGLRLVSEHICRVQKWMAFAITGLLARSNTHDRSKYSPEEIGLVVGKPAFDKYEYMSKEERAALEAVKESLTHHYAHNSHHPEHYPDGVSGMTLFDLIEMVCDWKAAGEMSPNGSFANSIQYNRERFNLSPEMVKILENTGREMGWME
jgi:hypothetical protein